MTQEQADQLANMVAEIWPTASPDQVFAFRQNILRGEFQKIRDAIIAAHPKTTGAFCPFPVIYAALPPAPRPDTYKPERQAGSLHYHRAKATEVWARLSADEQAKVIEAAIAKANCPANVAELERARVGSPAPSLFVFETLLARTA